MQILTFGIMDKLFGTPDESKLKEHGITLDDFQLFSMIKMMVGDSEGQKLGRTPIGIHVCRLLKQCTKTFTGTKHENQYYVECLDCKNDKGMPLQVCGPCIRQCHEELGHKVNKSDPKFGQFFCDCEDLGQCKCNTEVQKDISKYQAHMEQFSNNPGELFQWMSDEQNNTIPAQTSD